MKKLLSMLAITLMASTATLPVVACSSNNSLIDISLADDIVTDLGTIDDVSDEKVLEKFEELNVDLSGRVTVTSNTGDGNATISVIENDNKYKGEVDVNYSIIKININDMNLITDLEELPNSSDAMVLAAFKNKNPILNNRIQLSENNSENGTAIFTVHENDFFYTGSIVVTYSVITNSDLTILWTIDGLVTEFTDLNSTSNSDILAAFVNANYELNGHIYVDLNDEFGTAVIRANASDTKYVGSVTILYTIIKTDIVTLDLNLDLGQVEHGHDSEVLQKFNALNPDIDFDTTLKNNNQAGSATVVADINNFFYTGEVDVHYTIQKIDISSLDLILDIGEIDNANNETILQKFNEINSNFVISLIVDENDHNGNATLITNSNDFNYSGSINITYTITKTDISLLNLVKTFVDLENELDQTILTAFKLSNPNFDGLVYISENDENGNAIISVSDADFNYSGSIEITYTIIKIEISTANLVTSLINVASSTSEDILAAFKLVNPNFNEPIYISQNDHNGNATITIDPSDFNYTGSIEITYTVIKIDIATLNLVTNLGQIDDMLNETVYNKFLSLNSSLDASFVLQSNNEGIATIGVSDTDFNYTGSVQITYTIIKTIISDGNWNLNLENLISTSDQDVYNAFMLANPDFDESVYVSYNDHNGNATLTIDSNDFTHTGSLNVTYTIIKKDISSLNLVTSMGQLNDMLDQTILSKFKQLNPNFTGDVNISSNDDNGTAIITVSENDFIYTGSINLSYSIVKLNISGENLQTTLNNILSTSNEDVLKAFVNANSEIDESMIYVSTNDRNGNATITINENNFKYTGSVNITYTIIKQDISSLNLASSLGLISDVSDETILSTFKTFNPTFLGDIYVSENDENGNATITVSDTDFNYTGSVSLIYSITKVDLNDDNVITVLENLPTSSNSDIILKFKELNTDYTDVDLVVTKNNKLGSATITVASTDFEYQGSVDISYTIVKTNIATLGLDLTLGEISDASDNTVLSTFKEYNPTFTGSVSVGINANGNASIIVNALDFNYTGSVNVTYSVVKKELTSLGLITALTQLSDSSDVSVLAAFKVANPALSATLSVTQNDKLGNATITVASNDFSYKGSINVTYTITKTDISTMNLKTNLGNLNNANNATIVQMLYQLNPALSTASLSVISNDNNGNATISVNSLDFNYTGSVNVTYTIVKTNISTLGYTTNFINLANSNDATILEAFKLANPTVTSNISVTQNDKAGNATIAVNSSDFNYTGSVNVTYTIVKSNISTLNLTTNIGQISGTDNSVVLTAFKAANSSLIANLSVTANTLLGGATITVASSDFNYSGSINITYSIVKVNISTLGLTTNLGQISASTDAAILTQFTTLNPSLAGKVSVTQNDKAGNATISVNSSDFTYTGNISVTYTVIKTNISTLNLKTNLGQIATESNADVLLAFKQLNPTFTGNVSVTTNNSLGTATISVNSSDFNYTGSVNVTYTIVKIDIATIITEKTISVLSLVGDVLGTVTGIIYASHPELTDQVTITVNVLTLSVIVTAKPTSFKYTGSVTLGLRLL